MAANTHSEGGAVLVTLEAALVAQMKTYAGLAALVGARVYPGLLPPQTTYPAVTYALVSDVPEHAAGTDPGARTARLSTTCWHTSYKAAHACAAQVRAALSRFRYASAPTIQDTFEDTALDTYDPMALAHGRVVDFRVFYSEA